MTGADAPRIRGAVLRRRLPAGVRAAAVAMGIALAAGCSWQAPPAGVVTVAGGLWQFCRVNPFPWGGTETGGPGHANGTVTLCARWRYENGVTTLAEVRGFFTSASGYLKIPSLQFEVSAGFGSGHLSELVPGRVIPAQATGHASSADTGWFAAARLTGHSKGSVSWRRRDLYLSLELVAGGAHGDTIPAGDAGMPLDPDGQVQ
jgi:hypothetical protein